MSQLKIYQDDNPQNPLVQYSSADAIAIELSRLGVKFERWLAKFDLPDNASSEDIIRAYRQDIDELIKLSGYQSYDVINLNPDHPQKTELRQKFLAEHIHDDDEIRFFNRGKGLFTLHIGNKVYEILCEKNDLIKIPAGTPHWFDMGENPDFSCIRIFDTPAGWVANFTGSDIAEKFSRLAT